MQVEVLYLCLAWLGTYFVHSTILLGGAWLLTTRVFSAPRLSERVWRLAMVGGVVTASLQVGLGKIPVLGQLEFAADVEQQARVTPLSAPAPVTRVRSPRALQATPQPQARTRTRTVAREQTPITLVAAEPERAPLPAAAPLATTRIRTGAEAPFGPRAPQGSPNSPASSAPLRLPWETLILGAWGLIGGLGLLGFLWAWSSLSRHLSGRREIVAGPLRTKLDELSERAGMKKHVRLFASPKLLAPISHGWLRPKISLPLRALADLSPAQQATMLAHELAHATRRDPSWFSVYTLLERVLFFQPLNRLARRELHEIAEILCDDWAVRWVGGGRLALASCLTEIAQWILGHKRPALMSPGMAGQRGSQLGVRVERLLDDRKSPLPEPRYRWWAPASMASLGIVAFAAPGVSATPTASVVAPPPATVAAVLPIAEPVPVVPTRNATAAGAMRLQEEMIGAELQLLKDELSALREEFRRTGNTSYDALLKRLERQIQSLHGRRERLRTLLSLLLNAPRPAHEPRR